MITLSSAHDYVVLFAFAALFGAIGGIAYELAQKRSSETGSIELPRFRGRRFIELGVFSNMIIGAVAAVAISYFFTPEVQVRGVVHGVAVIQTKWQIVKVVPLSLIVGSAGGAFLEAMRGRVLGQLNAQKVATTQAVGKVQVQQLGQLVQSLFAHQTETQKPKILHTAAEAVTDAANELPASFLADLSSLVEHTPQRTKVMHLVDQYTPTQPPLLHINRVSDALDEATDTAAASASELVQHSVHSALAAIDAAAET